MPSWSPDGSRIAFACNGDIWTIGADGSSPVNLTEDPALPGGRRRAGLVAGRHQDRLHPRRDIWIMNADGSGKTQLTATAGGQGTEKAPDWSPDGAHLVYERSGQIWRMHADGTAQQPLMGGLGEGGTRPVWSPSGTEIIFASNAFDAPNGYDLFTMNPDGTAVTRLPMPVPGSETDPSWQAAAPTEPLPSYVALGVEAEESTIVAAGELFPARPGATVKVTLAAKQDGRYEKIKTRKATTDAFGVYAASFASPDATTCKVTAKLAADAERRSTSRTVTFDCP